MDIKGIEKYLKKIEKYVDDESIARIVDRIKFYINELKGGGIDEIDKYEITELSKALLDEVITKKMDGPEFYKNGEKHVLIYEEECEIFAEYSDIDIDPEELKTMRM